MFFRQKRSGDRTYLQLVENRWEDGKTKQRVVMTLGRLEVVQEDGTLDSLLRSGARFSKKLAVVAAHQRGEALVVATRRIGPALVFDRLWKQTGCQEVIRDLLRGRRFEFDVERAVFLTVLHRLFPSGSDRQADRWRRAQKIDGVDDLALHHSYRAMGWLGSPLPQSEQSDSTPFAPRCTKDLIEERLHWRRRDLFSSVDLVFLDTTSIYFEGRGGQTLGRHGHSKDNHPELPQMIVAAVIDSDGCPICCELWPGNTADSGALLPVVDRLRARFHVDKVCVVADRGMISKETIAELEERGLQYILGARMRAAKEVRDEVLSRAGRYEVVRRKQEGAKAPSPLKVKDVEVGGRRYVVCLNEDQKKKDAADREAILAALGDQLKKGPKSLVGNKGYRRYLKSPASGGFSIDQKKAEAEARFDGKWVLRTNTTLRAATVALKYKELLEVERLFRNLKSLLDTRPIFHRLDETIRGHVFCSFLALILINELRTRLEARGAEAEWADVLRDLEQLEEVELEQDGKRFLLRSPAVGVCAEVFRAAGVALPPTVRQISEGGDGP